MKKWIESWLIPLVNKYADTPQKKKAVYAVLMVLGLFLAWFGISLTWVSYDQIYTLDQGALK